MESCMWVVHLKLYRVELVYTEIESIEGSGDFTREFSWVCTVEAADEKDARAEAHSEFLALAREPPKGIRRRIVALNVTTQHACDSSQPPT